MDTILDQFDHSCTERTVVGLADVLQFLETLPAEMNSDSELVFELSKIAIELSWMRWPNRLETLSDKLDPDDLLAKFASVPRARDFFPLLNSKGTSTSHCDELVKHECCFRSIYADNAPPEYFELEYGTIVTPEKIDDPITVTSDFRSSFLKTELYGLCLFGRQRSTDPDDLQVEKRPEGRRIIIAPRRENRVSRNQMSLQLLSRKFAILQNTSNTNRLAIDADQRLELGEKRIVRFPFVISLPHQKLNFCHQDK